MLDNSFNKTMNNDITYFSFLKFLCASTSSGKASHMSGNFIWLVRLKLTWMVLPEVYLVLLSVLVSSKRARGSFWWFLFFLGSYFSFWWA